MPELALRICGLGLRLRADAPAFLRAARRRYGPFVGRGGPEVPLRLAVVRSALGRRRDEPRVAPGGRVERHDLTFDPEIGRATVLRSASALDGLLRIALSFEFVRRGGFLCHAAAVDGWLFPGRSGAGKSTLGRAVPPGRLLADELVGVRRRRLLGTPFWGDFRPGRNNGTRPLRALFFLDRDGPRGVHPLTGAAALARLLACVVYFGDDPGAAAEILKTARGVVEAAPSFLLSYDARRTGFPALERMLNGALR